MKIKDKMFWVIALTSIVFTVIISSVIGVFMQESLQASVNCNKYLNDAKVEHETGQLATAVPKSMLWELEAIENLQRYQICRQYGE